MLKIELFYTKACPMCPPAKALVRKVLRDFPGIDYRELDAREHQDRALELGFQVVPTIAVDGEVWCSGVPDEEKLRRRLAKG